MDTPRKPHVTATPKDFVLVLGVVLTLFVTVISLVTLLTGYIDHLFPDPLQYQYGYNPYGQGVLVPMAFLIVVVPIYLVLSRFLNKELRDEPEKRDLWVRRWAFTGALFVGAISIAITLIVLVSSFLQGELTTRFLLQVLAIVLVVGGFVLYYAYDLRGRWQERPAAPRAFGLGIGAVVVATILAGFVVVGTPGTLRDYREDDRRVSDLQSIQWGVIDAFQRTRALPVSIDAFAGTYFGQSAPVDPVTGDPYEYAVTGQYSFELCATFNRETYHGRGQTIAPTQSIENWVHEAGRSCFERTIDPAQYPPYGK